MPIDRHRIVAWLREQGRTAEADAASEELPPCVDLVRDAAALAHCRVTPAELSAAFDEPL